MLRTTSAKNARLITPRRHGMTLSTDAAGHHLVQKELRELLRQTAQPVAVVTARMRTKSGKHPFHGATLSSFTSIAMEPYPLVSFGLRIPSRMATSLKEACTSDSCHMVINLLSAEQSSIAVHFSRPDLHSDPFSTTRYTLTKEGLPMITGSLGALSCRLVGPPIPLHDLEYLDGLGRREFRSGATQDQYGDGRISELFIAHVLRVESAETGTTTHPDRERTLPLIYYRRGYTTCNPLHHPKSR